MKFEPGKSSRLETTRLRPYLIFNVRGFVQMWYETLKKMNNLIVINMSIWPFEKTSNKLSQGTHPPFLHKPFLIESRLKKVRRGVHLLQDVPTEASPVHFDVPLWKWQAHSACFSTPFGLNQMQMQKALQKENLLDLCNAQNLMPNATGRFGRSTKKPSGVKKGVATKSCQGQTNYTGACSFLVPMVLWCVSSIMDLTWLNKRVDALTCCACFSLAQSCYTARTIESLDCFLCFQHILCFRTAAHMLKTVS